MRMLVVSDIHLPIRPGALPLGALAHPRRLLGWLNYRFRRGHSFREAPVRLAQLVDVARAHSPDVILFLGDLSALGTGRELADGRRALQPLVESAPRFLCLPGNHDVYVDRAAWQRHLGDLCPHAGDEEAWPQRVPLSEEHTLFLLDSARPRTVPFVSNGFIAQPILDRLARCLDGCGGFRFVALHHGLWRADGRADSLAHGVANAASLTAVLKGRPRLAVLHGHLHQGFRLATNGYPPVYCSGSASQQGRAGGWLFEWGPNAGCARRLRYEAGAYRSDAETFPL